MVGKIKEFVSSIIQGEERDENYDAYDNDMDYSDDWYDEYNESESNNFNEEYEEVKEKKMFSRPAKKPVVIKRENIDSVRMQIIKPVSYEESMEIINLLKEKQSIVMNLETVSKEEGRRIIDTVSGGVAALDGKIVKVTNAIFIAAPENYNIRSESDARKSHAFNYWG